MLQVLTLTGIGLVTTALLDALWLGLVMHEFYKVQLGPIARMTGDSMTPIWPAAALVYVAIVTGIQLFVLPRVADTAPAASGLAWGALFGLVVYGLYDLTNYATLNRWSLVLTVVDIAWGAAICGSTTAILALARRWLRS